MSTFLSNFFVWALFEYLFKHFSEGFLVWALFEYFIENFSEDFFPTFSDSKPYSHQGCVSGTFESFLNLLAWPMFIVVNQKDFAETVDISTESFVQYVLGHISNLRLSDDSERGLNLHHITRFSKLGQFLWKSKIYLPFLKLREVFRRGPRPGFLFCLKQSRELLAPVYNHIDLAYTYKTYY